MSLFNHSFSQNKMFSQKKKELTAYFCVLTSWPRYVPCPAQLPLTFFSTRWLWLPEGGPVITSAGLGAEFQFHLFQHQSGRQQREPPTDVPRGRRRGHHCWHRWEGQQAHWVPDNQVRRARRQAAVFRWVVLENAILQNHSDGKVSPEL